MSTKKHQVVLLEDEDSASLDSASLDSASLDSASLDSASLEIEELLSEHRSGSYRLSCIISDEIKKDLSGECTLYELKKIATKEIYNFICDNIGLIENVKYENGNIKVDCEDGITCEKIEKLYELLYSKNSIGLPWDVSWFNGFDWDQIIIPHDDIYKLFLENKK